jgi:hypothetical protein
MPPSSRRTAATRPAPRHSPPSEGLEANAADPHGELLDDGAAPAATGRSSRRMTATSAKVPVTRGSRPLTAAEQEQKKANFRWGMKVAVLLVVLIAAGAAAFWFFGKEDPKQRVATAALADGRANLDAVEQALKNRQPDRARAAVSAGKKAIEIPALGNAVTPDPKDPNLAGVPYGASAVELEQKFNGYSEPIAKLERDNKAAASKQRVIEGFAKLLEYSDEDLDKFTKQVTDFLANPVEPEAGPRPDYAADYPGLIIDVQTQVAKIDAEKARRKDAVTKDQEEKAHGEAEVLVKSERYKEALDKLDEYAKKYEKADFASIRTYITDSATLSWNQAKARVESLMVDYNAPGTAPPVAAAALAAARKRLGEVIERFGVETIVSEAKDALGKLPEK